MTLTLQAQAQQTITDSVLKNTHLLIEALKDNYRQYSIRGHQRSVERNESVEHHQQRIDELRNGHAFVDKKTGEVYKSASWKSPAKGVRFDLRLINREYREWLFAQVGIFETK
jgi:hypothetical protein